MVGVKQIECFAQISNVLGIEAMFGLICSDPGRETIEAFRGNVEDGAACCGLPTPTVIGCNGKGHGKCDKGLAAARLAKQDTKGTRRHDPFDKPIRFWERR